MLMMQACFFVSCGAAAACPSGDDRLMLMMSAVLCLSVDGNRLMLMMQRCFCVSLRGRPADAHDAALFLRVPKGTTG